MQTASNRAMHGAERSAGGMLLDETAWAFLFDFDGTLVDIAESPDEVKVPRELGSHLASLSRRANGALAIITGRRIADIDRLLAPHRIDVAGVHGAELRIGSQTITRSSEQSPGLAEVLEGATEKFGAERGILIEDKGNSMAVHWRRRPSMEAEVLKFMTDASQLLGDRYRIQLGKAVAEIVPRSTSKGYAIGRILAAAAYNRRRPIYFGDDLTDESGFDAVNRAGGASVRIGFGTTSAQYTLPDTESLRRCLAVWANGGPIELRRDPDQ